MGGRDDDDVTGLNTDDDDAWDDGPLGGNGDDPCSGPNPSPCECGGCDSDCPELCPPEDGDDETSCSLICPEGMEANGACDDCVEESSDQPAQG